MTHYRSLLFVPGNRADRFEKACQSGADLICIDLEDAVGLSEKTKARNEVLDWLSCTEHKNVSLRINGLNTDEGQADIAALQKSRLILPFIMIPKVATRQDIDILDEALPKSLGGFIAIIEARQVLFIARRYSRIAALRLACMGRLITLPM